jgi:hypothetical protein
MITEHIEKAMSFEPPSLFINRFCLENNVTKAEAHLVFQETKKFIILCAIEREHDYSPSNIIDVMWHQFILHSKDYFRFCELIGGYVHHQPSETHKPDQYANTLKAIRAKFGDLNQIYWEENAAHCGHCTSCSNNS